MILRFLHGWGFDAGVWQHVATRLPEYRPEYRIELCDRGYFGASATPLQNEPQVLVTHSFGTMFALREWPAQCRGLIAINGFDCFTARDGFPGVPRRVVERMLSRFTTDPVAVLSDFRQRCGHAVPFGELRPDRLRADLEALLDWDCRTEAGRLRVPILSIQGETDPILPPPMRGAVFASAAGVNQVLHPHAGHLLPLTDPGFCIEHIVRFVERLR